MPPPERSFSVVVVSWCQTRGRRTRRCRCCTARRRRRTTPGTATSRAPARRRGWGVVHGVRAIGPLSERGPPEGWQASRVDRPQEDPPWVRTAVLHRGAWVEPLERHLPVIDPATEDVIETMRDGWTRRRGRRGGGGPLHLRQVRCHDRAGPCCPARPGDRGVPGSWAILAARRSGPRWVRRRRWRRTARVPAALRHLHHRPGPCSRTSRSRRSRAARWSSADRSASALITPWNWPLNQIAAQVARRWPPAADGAQAVEVARSTPMIFAEILDRGRACRPGVFNLVSSSGLDVRTTAGVAPGGSTWSRSPAHDRAGTGGHAARRQSTGRQELGSKSANIVLDDGADLDAVVDVTSPDVHQLRPVVHAPSRMLVPRTCWPGRRWPPTPPPRSASVTRRWATTIGPVVSQTQYDRIQAPDREGIGGAPRWWPGRGDPTVWTSATTSSPRCSPTSPTT